MKKLIYLISISIATLSFGQQAVDFLQEAKALASEENYEESLEVVREGLRSYPSDYDLRVFEVNVYLWKGEYAVANAFIQDLLTDYPKDYEVQMLMVKNYWWKEEWDELLKITEQALQVFPEDSYFAEKHLLALVNLERHKEALAYYQTISEKNSQIEKLGTQSKMKHHQQMGASFSYAEFDENFSSWMLGRLEYRRIAQHGWNVSATHGTMFDQTGTSFNMEFYPTISQRFRGFVEATYSDTEIFPEYRIGGELIASFGQLEVSAGAKTLSFRALAENANIYTAGMGMYAGNFYAAYKGFLLIDEDTNNPLTHSLMVRRSFQNRFHFIQLNATRGSTPLQVNNYLEVSRINATAVSVIYSHLVAKQWVINGVIGAQKEVYSEGNDRQRVSASIGVSKIF